MEMTGNPLRALSLTCCVLWLLCCFGGCDKANTNPPTKQPPTHNDPTPNKQAPPDTRPRLAPTLERPPKTPQMRPKPRPRPVEWYKPRYRERRFYPPRKKLKKLSYPSEEAIKPTIVEHGPRKKPWVALTFDACSWNSRPRFDRKVANILVRTKTPATLFMGGKWVLKRPKDAKWLASHPFFEIANHSYLHGHLPKVSKKRLINELKWTQEAIYTVLGVVPTLFRPPYLEFDKRVARVAGKLGLRTINGLSSGDPDPNFTKRVLVRYMKKAIKPGSIVVMHINKGGKHTAEALPDIIKNIKRKGYKLVTVGKMLGLGYQKVR